MSKLKRLQIKYIRDRAKSAYQKSDECYICASAENLDLHHTHSMQGMWEKWTKKNGIIIKSVDDIMDIRDAFIDEHTEEIYEHVFTLCHKHHLKLHSLYGKKPLLVTAPKQARWIEKQRIKYYGI